MQSVKITPNEAGQRFDKFLHKYFPEAGSGFLYKMLRKKNITLNGKKADGKEMLSVGDEVRTFFAQETFEKFRGIHPGSSNDSLRAGEISLRAKEMEEYIKAYQKLSPIEILYEDSNIVIVNKPAGILTQKAKPGDLSLNEWLIGYLLHTNAILPETLSTFHPSVCNRLDRNTSGLVLCGKSLPGSQHLSSLIKNRTIQKFYRTICLGPIENSFRLNGYLYKDEKTNKVTIFDSLPSDAAIQKTTSPIRTGFHPLTHNKNYTLLEVELITGKTHQIRSHLAYLGHPIIGDLKYGNPSQNQGLRKQFGLSHQLLHAYRIVFPKETGVFEALSNREIIAPYPKEFETIQRALF